MAFKAFFEPLSQQSTPFTGGFYPSSPLFCLPAGGFDPFLPLSAAYLADPGSAAFGSWFPDSLSDHIKPGAG
ncbi:hypothetical protein R80B4_01841 [Fibrobacteres bacterium R8-0-B4]